MDASKLTVRAIAFYLPQFHPIPENDAWWGKGFTEWTNVSKAVPQFVGHYQPHLPGELGFYDLRLPEVMHQQVDLARHFGIAAFCFHYYWFGGKRLLERPLEQFIADPSMQLSYCVCWANENWSRRWDGLEGEVLIAQKHSPEDDIAFVESLLPAFVDPRYVRVDGRPVLIVYRASLLPDARHTGLRWRQWAASHGLPGLYLVAASAVDVVDADAIGFDAVVEFPPHQSGAVDISSQLDIVNPSFKGHVYDYLPLAQSLGKREAARGTLLKTVMLGWDNDARKPGAGHTFVNATPAAYGQWLGDALALTARREGDERLVFINAWNEWAEGTHLEPDRRWGYAFLDATSRVLRHYYRDGEVEALVAARRAAFRKTHPVAIVVHLYYEEMLDEFADRYLAHLIDKADLFFTVAPDIAPPVLSRLFARFPNAFVEIASNRGRDIRPFLLVYRQLRDWGYDIACKIHSKKSPHREDGEVWRRALIGSLLDRDAVAFALDRFAQSPSTGLLMPRRSAQSLAEPEVNLGNRIWLDRLLKQFGMAEQIGRYDLVFPAGSMYWFRVAALAGCETIELEMFESEARQVDGTLAHAVERVVGGIAQRNGYSIEEMPA